MNPESPDIRLENLWTEIRRQMGVCPSFFRLAGPDPAIARGFFDLAKFAYLDNPLPSLFKETLFVSLSRFCRVRYCVTRHAAFLLGRGRIAGDPACAPLSVQSVMALLNEPFPGHEQLSVLLTEMEGMAGPLPLWPDYDSDMGMKLRVASTAVFLERENSFKWSTVLRRLLGPKQFVQLILFLAFVRIAHFWTQAHVPAEGLIPAMQGLASARHQSVTEPLPQLQFEEDLEVLLSEQHALAEILLRDGRERMASGFGEQLQEELQELRTIRHLVRAVQESEARYRDLYDCAPDMFLSIDAETGHILECNRTLLDKTGFDREEVIGRPVIDLYAPAYQEHARRYFQQFLTEGALYGKELQVRTREGTFIDVSLNATAVRDSSGRIISSRSTWRDISRQKFAENQLRLIFESSPNGLVALNEEGIILMVNSRVEQWFGYHREELLGQSIDVLIPERHRVSQPSDGKSFLLQWQAYSSEATERGRIFYGAAKDGKDIPLDIDLTPIGLEGEGTSLITMTNITERLRDKEALQVSTMALQEQLDLNKTLAEHAAFCLLLIDPDGRVTFANPATQVVTGFTSEELVGRLLHDVVHHSRPDGTPFPISECPLHESFVSHQGIQGHEDVFIHKDGRQYPVQCRSRAVIRQGAKWETILEIQDITHLQRAEEQRRLFTIELARQVHERTEELVTSQTRLRELATELNLAEQRERQRIATELHDYLSQLLVLSRLKLGQTRQILGVDIEEGLTLVRETEEVLDQALTYTRTLVAELSPPVLYEFGLRAALEWLVKHMAGHGLRVDMEYSDMEEIQVPEDQAILLFQSVRELFLNVLKHSGTDHARLMLHRQDHAFHILVQDQGKGFHKDILGVERHVSDHAVKFGLFSIRERMIAMGGSFDIHSSPGQGCTAKLIVPLQPELAVAKTLFSKESPRGEQATGTDHPVVPWNPPAAREMERIRILLVDDHVMVREGLRKVLEGHDDLELVGEAGNGEEALELVEHLDPALVIMDVNMPKLNGIEATTRIKAQHPEIIVIGLSVNTGGETEKAMLKAGAVTLLPKEAAVSDLYQTIKATSQNTPS